MSNRSVNSDRDEFENEEIMLGKELELDHKMININSSRGGQGKKVFI